MNITLVVFVLGLSAFLAFLFSICICLNIDDPKTIGIALFMIFVPLFFCLYEYEIDKTNKNTSQNNSVEVVNE